MDYKILEKFGLKKTPQRIEIWKRVFDDKKHITAEELYESCKSTLPYISLATVYRTLKEFEKVGLLRLIIGPDGNMIFDSNIEPHYHFMCSVCRKIYDIPYDMVEVKIKKIDNVEIQKVMLIFGGVCENCKKEKTVRKEKGVRRGKTKEK